MMFLTSRFLQITAIALFCPFSLSQSIAEINGNKFLSPYNGKTVTNVSGLVTAQGPDGFWIRSTRPDNDPKTSESIYVFGNITTTVSTGDIISLDGRVSEYRSSPAYLYLTEITKPSNVKVISKSNKFESVVITSKSLRPPTEQYTSLDRGDVFGLPGNSSTVSGTNPVLDPTKYGLDFWESLSGELVTVKSPAAVAKPNRFGDTWVVGDWRKTGQNKRGGLTLTPGDANPESILIGSPLDGSSNPQDTKLGDSLQDITGVVSQAFGYYRILPLTKLQVTKSRQPALPDPVKFKSKGSCRGITIGDYNIENYAPNISATSRAEHIVKYLGAPDLIFLQEIQDNNGPTNDEVVSANKTLETIISAISSISSIRYSYVDIDPVDDKDGGQPGGNIRVSYLYNPAVVRLSNLNPGSSTDAVQVDSGPSLSFNPGRIDPSNAAWTDSRKPLAAQWQTVRDNSTFFTVNVHFTSKGGSSSIQGDARAPINGGVDQRTAQANITASFIASILAQDPNAAIVSAGDFNEFAFVQPLQTFVKVSGLVDTDEAANVDPTERYTYLFDGNSQELDHVFVSKSIANKKPKVEHVHVNTWVSFAQQVSDHDPSVVLVDVCKVEDKGYEHYRVRREGVAT